MGPTIILDKSALQSLSVDDVWILHRHYFINVTPVLIIEILGDLKKFHKDPERAHAEVKKLVDKLPSSDSMLNVHRHDIAASSLLGYQYPLEGQIVVSGGVSFEFEDGEAGVVFDQPPERVALRRWRKGKFTETEDLLAEQWRETTKAYDLQALQHLLKTHLTTLPRLRTIEELREHVDQILRVPDAQLAMMQLAMAQLDLGYKTIADVLALWEARGQPPFQEFAPYAFHCFRIELAFILGLMNDLVGTRSTNRVDLECVLYSPFAHVFCSGDKFHKTFGAAFLPSRTSFISAGDLRTDLRAIREYQWPAGNKRRVAIYPPNLPGSFTAEMHRRHCVPFDPAAQAALDAIPREEILAQLKPKWKAAERALREARRLGSLSKDAEE